MGTISTTTVPIRPLAIEDFESTLAQLVKEIPPGVDSILDGLRQSKAGDGTYSTALNRQVRAFLLYRTYAETGTRFLDWGCRHAWDSCMVRMVNAHASIDGCDITEQMVEATRSFASMRYTQLTHTWKLPYADGMFDRVISSGVLEHAPISGASLMELNRIMAPGGVLIITFLPNRRSYSEFVSRNIFKRNAHRRLYKPSQLRAMLLENGFEPLELGHHQFLPSLTRGHASLRWSWMGSALRSLFKYDPWLEQMWPLRVFGPNLYAIARKRDYM